MSDADPSAEDTAANRLAAGAMSLPLLVLCLAALALPAALTYSLVQRGAAESHPSWIVLGITVGALWLLGLVLTLRSTFRSSHAE